MQCSQRGIGYIITVILTIIISKRNRNFSHQLYKAITIGLSILVFGKVDRCEQSEIIPSEYPQLLSSYSLITTHCTDETFLFCHITSLFHVVDEDCPAGISTVGNDKISSVIAESEQLAFDDAW